MAHALRRLPIESSQPVVLFAIVRLGLALAAVVVAIALGFPYEGRLVGLLAGVSVPWAALVLVLARRDADLALHPLVAGGDFVVLAILELVVPEIYGAIRFTALFLVAVHAHFQGEQRGLTVAAGGSLSLVLITALEDDPGPVRGDLLFFYESAFVAATLGTAALVGRLRTTESASRLRARDLTRRTLRGESEVRRRVAESIHDGPVQELIGLDMMLAAAAQAAEQGDPDRATGLIGEARELAEKNVRTLREEIVDLGPYAFEELSYAQAVENCVRIWRRRYGIEVLLSLEGLELPPEVAGHLFRVTQEAVVNAGRHARAERVSVSLRSLDGGLELRVVDDGQGFGEVDPLGAAEPGHLGLASMRERAELIEGRLEIETSERGTKVLLTAPLARRGRLRRRR